MSLAELPLISIVTPSYNQRCYIRQMLDSIHLQDYPYIEHIIIDGGSTDGTLELLEAAGSHIAWISEPDSGQAEALNKGFARAKGEIFGWLNCDDLYTPGALRTVAEYFTAHPDIMFLYGDALAIDEYNIAYGVRANVQACNFDSLVQVGDFIVQPAAFWRAGLWQQVGTLDESLHYALDYDYWMRAARRYPLHYVPICLAQERIHGNAKTSKGHLKRINELDSVGQRHGGTGIPYHFRAEAAFVHSLEGLQALLRADWQRARQHLGSVPHLRPPLLKYLIYLVATLLFGVNSIANLRLRANGLRSWRRPIYPAHANKKSTADISILQEKQFDRAVPSVNKTQALKK